MIVLTMLLIPTVVAVGFLAFGGRTFTLKEFLVQLGVQAVVMAIFASLLMWSNTWDTEVLNGRVTSKSRDIVSCSHSYSCNCRQSCSGSGKDRSCYTICDTCYEHSYDVDWTLHTSIGRNIYINRVDRQGLIKPSRWDRAAIGEPVAMTSSYTNYIKGAPDSLFRYQGLVEKHKKWLPTYPIDVYDYHHLNRFVTVGLVVPDAKQWNIDLEELNADLGIKKQVNLIVVVVRDRPQDYFYALQQHWLGSKKNDAVLVVSVDQGFTIQWAEVMAWTDNKLYHVTLADSIRDQQVLDRTKTIEAFRANTQAMFVRKPMSDFEYLKSSVTPTPGQWMFAMLFGTLLSIGLGIYFLKNDPFNDDWRNRHGYRY